MIRQVPSIFRVTTPKAMTRTFPGHFRLCTLFAVVGALAVTLAAPPLAAQQADYLGDSLSLEQRLMREDLSSYEQAAAAEAEARRQLDGAMSQLSALAGDTLTTTAAAGNLRRAEERAAQAAVAWRAASGRTAAVVARIEARLQRLRMLSDLTASSATTRVQPDVSGVWRVTMQPAGTVGVFDVDQSGTVLSGTYRMEDGKRGSLRGTLVANRVRLDRLDANQGFESIFHGEVDGSGRVIRGQWAPAELSDGGPGGGPWRAVLTSEEGQ